MATKADFTENEWKTMQKGVTGAGMFVSVSDADFTDSFGEVGALAKRLGKEHEENASELMRELAHIHGSGFGLTASRQEVEAGTIEALHSATAILAEKAPGDVDAYRKLVLDVADSVAAAKGGGVAPGEAGAIDEIKVALGAA